MKSLHEEGEVSAAPLSHPAIQIRIDDPKLQAYLQRYPFAQGPIPEMNVLGKRAIEQGIRYRPAAPKIDPVVLEEGKRIYPQQNEFVRSNC